MKRLLLILLGTMFFIGGVRAQDEVYTWEWGLALGCDFYMGDANVSRLYKNTHLAGALMARYLINPHILVCCIHQILKMRIYSMLLRISAGKRNVYGRRMS